MSLRPVVECPYDKNLIPLFLATSRRIYRCGSHNQTCASLQCATGCVMTSAGPQCYCEAGYQLDQADLATCVDVDECQVSKT